jgi:hypothetical protein
MYGLVNKAIEQMVCSNHGPAMWNRIKSAAEVDVAGFISNRPYPDEITYSLVAAASEALDAPAEEILKAFGEHWVLHTALESYGPMMRATGKTLPEFLLRLPHLHTRVELIYPNLRPPQFSCHNVSDSGLDLHYWTSRPPGLEPFVEGLILGLGKMFSTPVQVELVQHRENGNDHSVFRVGWEAAA